MPAAALIPAAIGVAGAVGSGIAGAAGVGKNSARATTFGKTDAYDANRFNYGGTPGGADDAANRYKNASEWAQTRQAAAANYGMADQARQGENAAANMMLARASGQMPTIAQMQGDRMMQQAQAAQASQAASARGPAAMALAQQNAANNIANTQGQIAGQTQINAAQEQLANTQAAMGAFGQMRGADAQQAQYNANLEAQQRALNDQFGLGMAQNEMGVRNSQLNAGMNQQQIMANSLGQAQGLNMGANQANAATGMQLFQAGLGSAMGGAQGSMSMMGGAPKKVA